MNLDAATATLRILASVAGVPNADSVSITLAPYKGNGERTFMKGAKVATATGWNQRVATAYGPARVFVPNAEGRDEVAAVENLVVKCRALAESVLDDAIAEEKRLLDEARAAIEATKALNVEARRAMLAAQ
jgi:hypothetical protein